MGVVFGMLVALSGCLRGMQCGRSASEVGDAATSAVVTGIVCIIVATGLITVACDATGDPKTFLRRGETGGETLSIPGK